MAPNGLAGSVAASTSAPAGSSVRIERSRSIAAGQGELGAPEPLHEVAAPRRAERLQVASSPYSPAKPPGIPSASTVSRVTIP